LIPLRDNLPTSRLPIVTLVLIALNVAVFVWQTQYAVDPQLEQIGLGGAIEQSAIEYGAMPYRLTHPGESECAIGAVRQPGGDRAAEIVCQGTPELRDAEVFGEAAAAEGVDAKPIPLDQPAWWVTIFTSMFMHGGILHLAGNMLFLWVFGNNIEDSMGRARFVLFYLLAGIVAVYAQSVIDPASTAPTIGASGAVAGVLGGYALLHPGARVLTLIFLVFFITVIEIPAVILLGIWFILQFLPAIGQTAITEVSGGEGIAYLAHVGGFVFGLAAIKLFANRHRDRVGGPTDPVY
jgi:membrane associated rhomboid family serine protease